MNILHLDSSPRLDTSASRELTQRLVKRLVSATDGAVVVRRDVGTGDIPLLQGSTLAQIRNLDPECDDSDMALTRQLVAELLAADVLVLGVPMYNFSVPAQMRAWLDRVIWAGKTFRYTSQGPEGLCRGKRAYIISTRGGIYSPPEKQTWDFQESYMRKILGFLGIEAVRIFRAEGLAVSPEGRAAALRQVQTEIDATLVGGNAPTAPGLG